MSTNSRRYDIDWLRVIAIGLLLLYHTGIGFQSWGIMIGFITNNQPWESLWIPMALLNIWRIPLLFFVSGMGVYFAMQQRNWKQLLQERTLRILVPFVFGTFVIFPVSVYIWQHYYSFERTYSPHPGHLWFLGNIFVYVIVWLPLFFYLKKNEDEKTVKVIKKIMSSPLGLLIVIGACITEVWLVEPNPFSMYAMTWHGFFLGLVTFFFGFCFVLSGDSFWQMLLRWRWLFLAAAVLLLAYRLTQFQMRVPNYLLSIESCLWIFTVLAFGHKHLNRPGKALNYLSQAAYPIYIIHMIFLFLGSSFIFPLIIQAPVQFILLLLFTFGGCFLLYEFIIRRINFLRPLFGMKIKSEETIIPNPTFSKVKNGAGLN